MRLNKSFDVLRFETYLFLFSCNIQLVTSATNVELMEKTSENTERLKKKRFKFANRPENRRL